MQKIRTASLWLVAIITLFGCAASRKTEDSRHEERRDSAVAVATDSTARRETKTDSTLHITKERAQSSAATSEKVRGEETIREWVTESTDAQGNKTTTTDRTVHRKGDYERSSTYEQRLERQEWLMERMQHVIDSIKLSNSRDVGTHWEMKDSVNVVKDRNTKDIKAETTWNDFVNILKDMCFGLFSLWIFLNFLLWVREKTRKWLK